MNKIHAKDYLVEFADQQDSWLKCLIYEAILTNGNISEDRLNEIYIAFKSSNEIVSPHIQQFSPKQNSNIELLELTHTSGVSALGQNQTIKFSPNTTILFGLNGSGKSSYFRILNEIVGGNQQKDIIPNIYESSIQPIKVEFKYKLGKTQIRSIIWNNTQRAYDDLKECKVFDSSYLNSFLEPHTISEAIVLPFGLHLFPYIVSKIDYFNKKLTDDLQQYSLKLPIIDCTLLREEFKIAFQKQKLNEEQIRQIQQLITSYSVNVDHKISEINSEIQTVSQINIDDKIKLYENSKIEVINLKNHFSLINKSINELTQKVIALLDQLKLLKDKNLIIRNKISVLKDIPNIESDEWKEFISCAMNYSQKCLNDNICPYCRQTIHAESRLIIDAYAEFLNDKSGSEIQSCEKELDNIKRKIYTINIFCNIPQYLSSNKAHYETVFDILNERKTILLEHIERKNLLISPLHPINIDDTILSLDKIISELEVCISKLQENRKVQNDKINDLEQQKKSLLEIKSLYEQNDSIKSWITINREIHQLQSIISNVSTTKISNLSKKAHNELITESLLTNFKNELILLKGDTLKVSLKQTSVSKGTAKTQIVLKDNKTVKNILSEGEQKAVALALFLAEIKTQATISPIIFDDPVNSLDHKIAATFANRLIQLPNQLVIFTHDRLFLDTFECTKEGHICKNFDGGCNSKGKHIRIYDIQSEGDNMKGVLIPHNMNNSKEHLNEAKRLLAKRPFVDNLNVSTLIRRSIECIVDEKILNRIIPTKYSNKNSRINWEELKHVGTTEENINDLNKIHSRVSGGGIHEGNESIENPIEKEEFCEMIATLETILNQQ